MTRAASAKVIVIVAYTALGAVLGACTGSLFQSKAPPLTVYRLSARLAATGPSIPADLAVFRPRVRTGLDLDRIAVLYADRHLDYFADARWSGPLDQVMQDLALQAFHTGSRLRNVGTDASQFTSGYWLEIEVDDFQAEYTASASAPTIRVHLLARLGSAGERRVLVSFEANAEERAAQNRLTDIVAAYERAADAALAVIVADTDQGLSDGLEYLHSGR